MVRIEPETRRVVIGDRDELDRRELTARELQLAGAGIADDVDASRAAALRKFATTPRRSRPR